MSKRLSKAVRALKKHVKKGKPMNASVTTLAQFRASQREGEGEFLRAALAACEWKIVPTAERLGCSPSMVRRLLETHEKVDAERRVHRVMDSEGQRGRPVEV